MEKDLTVQMFEVYQAVQGPVVASQLRLYKQKFRKTGLIIAPPRSDTCAKCDKLILQFSEAATPVIADEIEWESIRHHLVQVIFCPLLTHADYFYQRKYSYYLAVTSPNDTSKSFINLWLESLGGRGSDEVVSCVPDIDLPASSTWTWRTTDTCDIL
jgi:hypothetical protein